jgi:hypothetical protein
MIVYVLLGLVYIAWIWYRSRSQFKLKMGEIQRRRLEIDERYRVMHMMHGFTGILDKLEIVRPIDSFSLYLRLELHVYGLSEVKF